MSKRRRGYPSETNVERGHRVVHGDKELVEKLGGKDPCPCGSGRRFPILLPAQRPLSTAQRGIITSEIDTRIGDREAEGGGLLPRTAFAPRRFESCPIRHAALV